MMRRVCGLLLALICGLGFASPVNAVSDDNIIMSLRPSEQELTLDPGQKFNGSVVVYNVGKVEFDFEASVAPYQVKNDDYEQDFVSESESTRMANWITLENTHYTVKPNQSAEVKFSIDVPEDVPGGGQYAAIIIRTDEAEEHTSGISVIGQIAALLYGHINGDEMRATGELANYHFPSLMFGDEFKISSTIENTGNIDFRVLETLTIKDFFTNNEAITPESTNDAGYPVGTVSATVLPGTARTINMDWKGAPQIGLFRVKHTISYLGEEQVTEKVVLLCPLWLIVLVAILLAMMIIWLIMSLLDCRREKPQVL